MQIEFYIGPGSSNFDHRSVRILDVGSEPPVEVHNQNYAGTTETIQVDLTANRQYMLRLIDRAHGLSGAPAILNFNTQAAGISFQSGGGFGPKIIGVEDESSSSASSQSSSSSSLSSSSTSSLSSGTSMSSSSSSSPSSLSSTSSPTSASSSSSTSSSRSSSSSSVSSSSSSSLSSSSLSSSSSSSG